MEKFLNRESSYPILPLLLSRVSYRAFSEERLTDEELMSLFEAAHWAPSSANGQPWRFIYARRGEKEWDSLYDLLIDFNKTWCAKADTLVLVISRNTFEYKDKPCRTSQFDTGAAWMSLVIEAHSRNFLAHAMEGFNYEAAKKNLGISDAYTINAMISIGKHGNKDDLPEEIRAREVPSMRKPVAEVISKGKFTFT